MKMNLGDITKGKRRRHTISEIIRREIGVKTPWCSSIRVLRHLMFGPRRCFKLVYKGKENSLLEFNNDLMWVTDPYKARDKLRSVMNRICLDGSLLQLYKTKLHPRPKQIFCYDVPHPVYNSSVPRKEYRSTLIALKKGNILVRQDLHTGEVFDTVDLGRFKANSMNTHCMEDVLIVKSNKLSVDDSRDSECFFHFHVFQLHPFVLGSSFTIDGDVFPATDDKDSYGKLRDVEIHEGMVLVHTSKDYTLIYNAQDIIESNKVNKHRNGIELLTTPEITRSSIKETPPLLFVTHAHNDVVQMGACPWAYIHAVRDDMLHIRDLKTKKLFEGGQVMWERKSSQEFFIDYIMFFLDDSNRLLHVKPNKLRVLEIIETEDNRTLKEIFRYPENDNLPNTQNDAVYSRSGRLVKNKFIFDPAFNRSIAFDLDIDLMVMVIVEAWRDTSKNVSYLAKVSFYDGDTFSLLHQWEMRQELPGDIETNRLSVNLDRDMLHIVSYDGSSSRVFFYRLKESWDTVQKESRRKRRKRRVVSGSSEESSDSDYSEKDRPSKRSNVQRKEREPSARQQTLRNSVSSLRASGSLSDSDEFSDWSP